MSCPNFETQEEFKLYLWDYTRPCDDVINDNIIHTEFFEDVSDVSDITEEMRDKYCESEREWEYDDIIRFFNGTVKEVLHTLNRELQFFKVILKDGHYGGLQFFVEEDNENLSYVDVSDITNEDTRYYFDMCKSEFIRKYNSEINFINNKLLPKLAKIYNFEEYYCGGIFSNGEAVYYPVTNDVRQALKEVA